MTVALPRLPTGATVEIYPDERTWLAGRTLAEHQIGGSDVASLMSRAPDSWGRGPWTMWARARGLETSGFTAAERADLDRGHEWELHILRLAARDAGVTLALHGRRAIVRHPVHPWATVSPDDFGLADGVWRYLEAKTARHGAGEFGPTGTVIETWDDASASLLPVHYALQVLWGLHITGLPFADVVVAIPQSGDWPEVRTIRLMAQPDLQAALFDAVAERRERWMVHGERPDIDATDDCGLVLRQLFPAPVGKPWRDADRETWDLVERRAALKAQRDALDAEYKLVGNQLVAAVGEDYGLRLPGDPKGPRAIVVRVGGREGVDLVTLRRQHPDLLAALTERGLVTRGQPFSQVRLYGFGSDDT